jgi:repressor LexA
MTELTKAQRRVLDFSQAELQAGRPAPTLREIAERFGFAGYRAAAVDLEALKRKGFLETGSGKARALRIISPSQKLHSRIMDIPVFGSIPAGFAQDKEQAAEGCVSVDVESIGFKPKRNPFALRVGEQIGEEVVTCGVIESLSNGRITRSPASR